MSSRVWPTPPSAKLPRARVLATHESGSLSRYDLVQTPSNATCETPRVLYIHGGDWDSDRSQGIVTAAERGRANTQC